MTDRKKPTAGFWITVALVAVLVGYPLSFGLLCRINTNRRMPPILPSIYLPIGSAMMRSQTIERAVRSYGRFWIKPGEIVMVPIGRPTIDGMPCLSISGQ